MCVKCKKRVVTAVVLMVVDTAILTYLLYVILKH